LDLNTSWRLRALVAGTTMGVMERRLEVGQIRIPPLGSFGGNPIGRTSKLVDAVFGELPGALPTLPPNLAIGALEARRRIVIYDFRPTLREVMGWDLARMLGKKSKAGIETWRVGPLLRQTGQDKHGLGV